MKIWNTAPITLSLLLFFSASVFAQVNVTLPSNKVDVETYEFTGLGVDQTYFRMPYANANITNPGALKYVKDKVILKIDLVYTDYPKDEDLTELNRRRMAALYALSPDLFSNPATQWRIVRQTGCQTMDEAFDYFHGFAVTYTTKEKLMASQAELLEGVVNGEVPMIDSTIYKIMDRNKDKWKHSLIVTDLTGSMSPYAGQLLVWFKLNAKQADIKHFVFFNDGDFTPNMDKILGNTGGIYHSDAVEIDTVLNVAQKTMTRGDGGDTPENDIEAIMRGLEACPECEDIILIADNLSDMRDYEMIDSLGKPVKVVICGGLGSSGTDKPINQQYIDLAWMTKGSLHTIEQDIENLMDLNEGEVIEISGIRYTIREGEFIRLAGL